MHDPRAFAGMAVTYALSPRGACHMQGDMYGVDAGQGFAVTPLNSTAADFLVVKGPQRTLVSCKRWKAANHGVEALRELVAAKEAQTAQQCTYLSLAPVSDTAQRFARAQGVSLMSGDALARFLLEKPRA